MRHWAEWTRKELRGAWLPLWRADQLCLRVSPTEQSGYLLLPGCFVNYSKQDKQKQKHWGNGRIPENGHAISAGQFKAVNWCLLLITAAADSPAQDDRNIALSAGTHRLPTKTWWTSEHEVPICIICLWKRRTNMPWCARTQLKPPWKVSVLGPRREASISTESLAQPCSSTVLRKLVP